VWIALSSLQFSFISVDSANTLPAGGLSCSLEPRNNCYLVLLELRQTFLPFHHCCHQASFSFSSSSYLFFHLITSPSIPLPLQLSSLHQQHKPTSLTMAAARIVASRAFASVGTKVARPAVRASFANTVAKRTITSTSSSRTCSNRLRIPVQAGRWAQSLMAANWIWKN
jgi:hypothetical protein